MFFEPSTIASADVAVARKHSVGGEKKLYISGDAAVEYGDVLWAADGSGVWTPDGINTLPTTGTDLQVKVDGELLSDSNVVLTVTGTDQNSAALTGTATLTAPGWVANKSKDFMEGCAVDVVPGVPNKKFKTITDISVVGGKKSSKVRVFSLPESWQYIDCVEAVEPRVGTRPAHPIADGLDGAADVTVGRSEPSEVRVSAKNRSVMDGLMRFAGRACCLRLEIWKQGKVLTERHVYANCVLSVDPSFPDGSEESKQSAAGMMEDAFFFFAR